ncbi:unnamed protein product [Rhizophagus irregularis]|nr:unnamed protein product [Rhizophagus irregularis]
MIAYGITDINPLLEDDGMSVLFLDSRGFENILYHPEKKCIVIKDTGEIIPDEELERQAEKSAEAKFANRVKVR